MKMNSCKIEEEAGRLNRSIIKQIKTYNKKKNLRKPLCHKKLKETRENSPEES